MEKKLKKDDVKIIKGGSIIEENMKTDLNIHTQVDIIPEKNTDRDSLKNENPEDIKTMSSLFFPKFPRATNAPINTMIGMNFINELGNFMREY